MSNKPPNQNKKPFKPNKFIRFASTGLQMGLTIWLGNELGKWLDARYQKNIFETILTLASIFISIYFVISQVIKVSKDD